jgi:dihydroflavonol-4-reductase
MAVAALTGASGLLGSNLAAALLAAGHKVRATRRGTTKVAHLDDLPIDWVQGDLADTAALTEAFRGADVVFHCAASVHVKRAYAAELEAVNVQGVANVLEAVRAAGVPRLVHTSSNTAIGVSTDGQPCTEATPWNLFEQGIRDPYGESKHRGEEMVLASGLDVVVVNPTFLVGPRDARPSSAGLIIEVAQRKVPGWTPGFNNFVDVRDVARSMIAAWQKGRRGERYILGGENLQYRDIFERFAKATGVPPPKRKLPYTAAAVMGRFGDLWERLGGNPTVTTVRVRYAFTERFIFSSAKAAAELGHTVSPIDDAIRDAVEWFRAHSML